MTPLKGKVAIVTGAGRGMGRAIAAKLAQCGAHVALVDLEAPVESAALAGPSAIAFAGDVSNEATWAKLGEAMDRTFERQDNRPTTYRAGEVFAVSAGQKHSEEIGSEGARVLVGRKY